MPRPNRNRSTLLVSAAFAAAMIGATAPALAQEPSTTLDELVITGRYGADPNVRTLSGRVPYSGLDLNTAAGRDTLKQRVTTMAANLCDRLREPRTETTIGPSCIRDAMNSAREQVRLAIASKRMPSYAYLPEEP